MYILYIYIYIYTYIHISPLWPPSPRLLRGTDALVPLAKKKRKPSPRLLRGTDALVPLALVLEVAVAA